jgi:LPS export ABC transporter protein LptC
MANRKRQIKIVLTGAVVAGLAVLAVVFLQLRSDQEAALPVPMPAVDALMTLAKVHQTATKGGKVQWELDAESAQLEAKGGRMILKAPVVEFHMEDGTKVHLTAEKGILHTSSNDMEVTGNVHLHNDRYTLLADVLVYQHKQRMLRSDAPVHIKSAAMTLRADKMTYNLDKNLAKFIGRVEGSLDDGLPI